MMVDTRIKCTDVEKKVPEIEKYLKQGKSVNQIMRLIGVTTDKTVRVIIRKYPHLKELSDVNGRKNQFMFGKDAK